MYPERPIINVVAHDIHAQGQRDHPPGPGPVEILTGVIENVRRRDPARGACYHFSRKFEQAPRFSAPRGPAQETRTDNHRRSKKPETPQQVSFLYSSETMILRRSEVCVNDQVLKQAGRASIIVRSYSRKGGSSIELATFAGNVSNDS